VELGTSLGAHDLLDSGIVQSHSLVASLPPGGVVFGRVWTLLDGVWTISDSVFTLEATTEGAQMVWLGSNDAFEAGDAFRWTSVPLAKAYRLRIGTSPGEGDVHDSGYIHSLRRLVDDLPANRRLYGSLDTGFIDGTSVRHSFEFTTVDASVEFADRWEHAQWATREVRGMADIDNIPHQGTLLLQVTRNHARETSAACPQYAKALEELIWQSNLGLDVRILNVCLNPNDYDCHTLVEVLDPATDRWLILDPTFGLAIRRVADSQWATALDMYAATRDEDYAAMEYVMLTDSGELFARSYYLDYPLLFAHVWEVGSVGIIERVDSTQRYYDSLASSSVSLGGMYAIRCTQGHVSTLARIIGPEFAGAEGGIVQIQCDSDPDRISHVFYATEIAPIAQSNPFEVLRPRRPVFD
jgi:hypothetical protein